MSLWGIIAKVCPSAWWVYLLTWTALLDMGNESLVGITDLVAGEKDPRNLILIFSMLRVIMVEWNIEGHEEVRHRSNWKLYRNADSNRVSSSLFTAIFPSPLDLLQMIPTA